MKDIATDFRENARVDVNDVLNDTQEDIQLVANDVEDLKEEIVLLRDVMKTLSDAIVILINKDKDSE